MKALPKRKGNDVLIVHSPDRLARSLNESPSEKEGKFSTPSFDHSQLTVPQ